MIEAEPSATALNHITSVEIPPYYVFLADRVIQVVREQSNSASLRHLAAVAFNVSPGEEIGEAFNYFAAAVDRHPEVEAKRYGGYWLARGGEASELTRAPIQDKHTNGVDSPPLSVDELKQIIKLIKNDEDLLPPILAARKHTNANPRRRSKKVLKGFAQVAPGEPHSKKWQTGKRKSFR